MWMCVCESEPGTEEGRERREGKTAWLAPRSEKPTWLNLPASVRRRMAGAGFALG